MSWWIVQDDKGNENGGKYLSLAVNGCPLFT